MEQQVIDIINKTKTSRGKQSMKTEILVYVSDIVYVYFTASLI